MFDPGTWSLPMSIGAFCIAALVIGYIGAKMAGLADRLADSTGMGEALMGALFLGASTSLPGIITSVVTAANGYPQLSVSNALGGIAAQTAFLAIADIAYRKANLEHAAASVENMMQGTLLIALLAIPLLAMASPEIAIWGIHPISLLMIVAYMYGLHMIRKTKDRPMWEPRQTSETMTDEAEEVHIERNELISMWLRFALFGAIVGFAGWIVGRSGEVMANSTGLSETVIGSLFTAVSTSLPELVTSIAAVRRGALTLAVSGIIGGNAFDTLFVAAADVAYRDGSIYHAITEQQIFLVTLGILMTSILILGLLRREKSGIGNIGFESFSILVLYGGALGLLFFSG